MKPNRYKKDLYHKKAVEKGYRSRAAFKLIQIDDKYNILKNARRILDLGCAPGSWLEVIIKRTKNKPTKIIGIDQTRTSSIPGAKILKMDVFSKKVEKMIENEVPEGFELIISDMAPNTTGNRSTDSARSFTLAERAFNLARKYLIKNGDFVAKIFHSPDLKVLIQMMTPYFKEIHSYKPKASRKNSREIYIIALTKN
ncbi:MAG: rRNA methyltransferase [Candidatus Lokiarchaeota archaeon]|nr:rRNA methyltransferase [Candidatus Lokiarchaeota archaeon]